MRLLTGFPGFLGSARLARWLDRGETPVTCLVQERYSDLAARRAVELTDAAGVDESSVRLVVGDVTADLLGLDRREYDRLAARTFDLFHLAAVYDLGVDRSLAERVNVDGTRRVLAFAAAADVEALHYVSTCYVSGRYDGTFTHRDLDVGQSFHNHYEATKFDAEALVRERVADGLPATVYRPAITVGDSRTGETQKFDGPYYLLRLILRQPGVALVPVPRRPATTRLNVVPRDFVVDAVDAISRRDGVAGETFQLANPHPPTIRRLAAMFGRAADRRVVPVPATTRLARVALERVPGLTDRLGVEPAALPYLSQPTEYASTNTRRALADTGIRCPLLSSYVDRLVAFARENPDADAGAMV